MTGDATRVVPDDGGDQGRGRRHRRQQGVHVVLLQPERLPALVHAVPRRVHQGADPGAPDASIRHPAADASRPEVRRACGRPATSSCATSTSSLIIEEMYRGANVIYADFTDYDELAHHCGPERVESFEALDGVDAAIATLDQGDRGRAAAVQVHRPLRPRPEPRRDVPAALRDEPRRVRPRA